MNRLKYSRKDMRSCLPVRQTGRDLAPYGGIVGFTNDGAGYFYGDGQNTSWPKRLLRRRPVRLRLPLSLSSKEICGQPNGNDSFAEIGNHFSDKFPALIANNNHRLNNIMPVKQCQAEVRPFRVILRSGG